MPNAEPCSHKMWLKTRQAHCVTATCTALPHALFRRSALAVYRELAREGAAKNNTDALRGLRGWHGLWRPGICGSTPRGTYVYVPGLIRSRISGTYQLFVAAQVELLTVHTRYIYELLRQTKTRTESCHYRSFAQ